MKFVDKEKFHDREHRINVEFLKLCYSESLDKPDPSPDDPNKSFSKFKRYRTSDIKEGVGRWLNLLLEEQHDRCCYCMRKLHVGKGLINIEHVIPRSLKGQDGSRQYDYYSGKSKILSNYVMMSDEFAKKRFDNLDEIGNEIRMPHITALANLLAACNGVSNFDYSRGCCCNRTRRDDMIAPLMLMEQNDDDVMYDENGLLIVKADDVNLSKVVSGLNNETLMNIRSVWYHLSKVDVDIENAFKLKIKQRIEWFEKGYHLHFASLPDSVRRCAGIIPKFDFYWKLLLDYDWFYDYYRNHYR